MNPLGPLLALLILAAIAMPVSAGDLYSARVPVTGSDDAAALAGGLALALQTVVEQVTGDAALAASARFRPEYEAAARYATAYRFVDDPDGQVLEASFEPSAVDRMLKRQGVKSWTERPTVLVWMAAPLAGTDQLLPADTGSDAWQDMDSALRARGYAMLRPLMDLEDQMRLAGADIVARRSSKVREASVRYDPDAMISVYLSGSAEGWQADWMLLSGELTRRWTTRGADQVATIETGVADSAVILGDQLGAVRGLDLSVSGAAEAPPRRSELGSAPPPGPLPPAETSAGSAAASTLSPAYPQSVPAGSAPSAVPGQAAPAEQFATRAPAYANQVLVRVAGIGNSGDYRRAMSAFQGNEAISALEVVAVEPDSFIVAVTPASSEAALADSLAAGGVLTAEPSGGASAAAAVSMYYRLNP